MCLNWQSVLKTIIIKKNLNCAHYVHYCPTIHCTKEMEQLLTAGKNQINFVCW